ncbi:MAG: hypothetical protein R6V01_09640 [Thermoplasmatota archaeon]
MKRREPAYPLMIKEIIDSVEDEVPSEEGRPRSTFVTITGANVYRVMISGILMEKVDIGSEDSPILRVRVADPTGGITFTVGRFDPEVQRMMEDVRTTYPVVVVGRLSTFVSKRGNKVITINPEIIREIDKEERAMYNLMAARDAMARLWKLEGRGPLPGSWMEVVKPDDPRGGEEVVESSKEMIRDTLRFLNKTMFAKELDTAELVRRSPPEAEDEKDPLEEYEDMVVDIINELDGGSGTRWNDLVDYVERKKLSRDAVEEVVTSLLDKGLVYEPVLGYLKAI